MIRPPKYPRPQHDTGVPYSHVLTGCGTKPSFKEFVQYHWALIDPAKLKWSWHMDTLCDHYTAWSEDKWFDWIVNVPPRHSKSIFSNVFFPAWMWLDRPELRFLLATSDAKLTNRDSALFKRVITEPDHYIKRYGRKWRITEDQSARDQMTNSAMGARITVAIGTNAAVTGHNGDYIITDDANQALAGAESETIRDKVNTWYDVGMSTRGVDSSAHRLIQGQRVHEEDLTGHILANYEIWKEGMKAEGGVWVHLCLRAFAEPEDTPDTPIWKEPRLEGEILCPERFSLTYLNAKKKTMRNNFFSQYQQRPSNPDGDKFKKEWFRYFESKDGFLTLGDRHFMLKDCWRFISSDLAIGEKVENDFTVINEWIVTPEGDMCLENVMAFQAPHHEVKEIILARNTNFGPTHIAIDGSLQGTEIQQSFSLVGIPVQCIPNSTDKIVRSMPASILMQNGKIWFKAGADWLSDLEHELLVFPNGKHDDRVDALSYGVLSLQGASSGIVDTRRDNEKIGDDRTQWRRRGFFN